MNIKLALASLLVSVVMSCGVSQGQLLDRMLSKAGCSSCGATSGCSGGLLSGGCGSAEPCSLGLSDKLKGRVAGGCGCAAPVADCGCEEAPVVMKSSCGCESAAPAESCGCGGGKLLQNLRARYDGGVAAGCGCEATPVAEPCGCEVAPVAEPCGCEAAPAPAPVADCGCSAAPALPSASCEPSVAPVFEAAPVSSCGCGSAAPAAAGGSLLDRLRGKVSSLGNGGGCGCSAAPVESGCGCDAAPAPVVTPAIESSCGCSAPEPAPSCGCAAAAPVASACGCAASSDRPKLTLLDRLRGNRIPRDRDGRVIGGGCNDGCNPPCPQADAGCGCEAVPAPVVDSGCSSCTACGSEYPVEGEVLAAPLAGAVIYDDGAVAGETVVTEQAAPIAEAVESIEPAEASDVIQETLPKTDATPEVDPNAFIPRRGPSAS